ncbi:cell cycle checkpoint [Hesseltinella vesiculosa]|uniref:Checkpoint protein n=1 Tax=Hesseltinella vesiculosa TaxID=101127 RepID=A0A1X2GYH0_9FUNG|nr:cell cycle checkpoint [Hesseltinella vesiculosa]
MLKIALAMEKLGPTCILCMTTDSIMFINSHDQDAGVHAWIKTDVNTLFSGYRIASSSNNEIYFSVLTDSLIRVARVAQQAAETRICLTVSHGQPLLEWRITLENRVGSTNVSSHELEIQLLTSERMQPLMEPPVLPSPQAYILLPSLQSMKHLADRAKSLSKFLTVSANMNGQLKLVIDTELAQVDAQFNRLENPRLDGHHPSEQNRTQFVSARIATDDLVHFLHCHHLDPQNVICAITDQMYIAFYVYVNLNIHIQADDHPIETQSTIMTCHLPVYHY